MEASQSQSQSQCQSHDIELGLKSLTLCCPISDKKLHHNSCIMASNLMSPPPSPAALSRFGDYIGMESCVDMEKCDDVQLTPTTPTTTTTSFHDHRQHHHRVRGDNNNNNKRDSVKNKAREFPPPISLLARTENLSSYMPFVLKRYHTNDGRLILREERVRHHEYFRVERSNGHLTLQLVLLDDEDELFFPFDDENENEHEHTQNPELEAETEENFAEEEEDEEIEGSMDQKLASFNDDEGIELGSGRRKSDSNDNEAGRGMCLNYDDVIRSSSCYLGVPVPAAMKPVQT